MSNYSACSGVCQWAGKTSFGGRSAAVFGETEPQRIGRSQGRHPTGRSVCLTSTEAIGTGRISAQKNEKSSPRISWGCSRGDRACRWGWVVASGPEASEKRNSWETLFSCRDQTVSDPWPDVLFPRELERFCPLLRHNAEARQRSLRLSYQILSLPPVSLVMLGGMTKVMRI